jgi:tRNA pseudouridine38-40 synthase
MLTFDCTILEAMETKNNNSSFYDSANRFLKYGSFYCGTLVNVGLNKITLDDFNAIIVHKTEIKLGFQYQHMVVSD